MKKKDKVEMKPAEMELHQMATEMALNCDTLEKKMNHQQEEIRHKKVNTMNICNGCQNTENIVQINSVFDAEKLNTAFDGNGGALASGSGRDYNWEVGVGDASGPGSVATWSPAFVHHHASWVSSPFNNANWISYSENGKHLANNTNLVLYFRIRFMLNENISINDFQLDMSFFADNSVNDIYVNGASQKLNYPLTLPQEQNDSAGSFNYVGFKKKNVARVSLAEDWKKCENELIVKVHSQSGYVGLLVQNSDKCYEAETPNYQPQLEVKWGESDCDCLESDDIETMTLTICNRYSNIDFKNVRVASLEVVHENGKPVATLPNGKPSIEIISGSLFCFGDIGPCSCITREFGIVTRGAKQGRFKLKITGICYDVCLHQHFDSCFEFDICKD